MPEDMPEHMPEDMPGRMPEDMPDRMPEDMSDRMPEDVPDRTPDSMSDRMPEDMPDKISEDMPDRMPEDMPEHMPEDMPVRVPVTKCINVMVGITGSKVFFLKYCSATTCGSASTTCCVRGIGSAWRTLERMRLVATPRRGPRIQKFVTRHSKWESICLVERKVICGG